MKSRERMLAVMNHQVPDRVPTDFWATGEVWTKLRKHFGEKANILEILHVDGMSWVGPTYTGPAIAEAPAGQTVDFWGIRHKKISYDTGEYEEISHYPLAQAASIGDLEAYAWPRADWFDYSQMAAAARKCRSTQVVSCGYMAPFTYQQYLRGLESSLMDPLVEPEFTRHLLKRLCDFQYEHHRRMFEAAEGLIDVTQVTDDYGMQTGPIMSLATFREFYRPHLKRFIDLAHGFGIKVMHHDDGAMRDFLPDLTELGIDILNPIQWRCPGMDMEGLKRDFGAKLTFHGAIDNQQTLPFGTPEDVRAEVRRAIDVLASDKTGYILAPCHNIQNVTPIENIVAMFDEAQKYGKM